MSVAALDRLFFYSTLRLKKTHIMARASQQNKSENSPDSGALRYRRIVVKAGTGALTGPAGLDSEVMADLVRQVCQVRDASGEVLLVTSGAIAAGRSALGQTKEDMGQDISSRQVFAAVGQSRLMHTYQEMFAVHDRNRFFIGLLPLNRDLRTTPNSASYKLRQGQACGCLRRRC